MLSSGKVCALPASPVNSTLKSTSGLRQWAALSWSRILILRVAIAVTYPNSCDLNCCNEWCTLLTGMLSVQLQSPSSLIAPPWHLSYVLVTSQRLSCRSASVPAQYTGFHRHAAAMPGFEVSSSASFHAKASKSIAAAKCSGPRRSQATMMPVGVPRVPYRLPRTNYWAWVDIWNCLYRERIVFISKVCSPESRIPGCVQCAAT